MIREFDAHDGTDVDVDVCIVGAGAAGIALARALSGNGLRIALLETGGRAFEDAAHGLSAGESVGLPFSGLQLGRHRGLGGTTRTWAGQCIDFDDVDFAARDWVPDARWPFSRASLEPWYRRAESVFKLSHEAYDARAWTKLGLHPPSFDDDAVLPRFTIYSPQPDLGRSYQKELERSGDVAVWLHAHALRVRSALAGGRVLGVEAAANSGLRAFFRARFVAICCGGIESARLLLVSDDVEPRGLGNARDLVGRFYQDHPNGITATIRTEDPRRLQDLFGLGYRGRVRYFPKLRLSPAVQRRERVLNGISHPVFRYESDSVVDVMRDLLRALRGRKLPPDVVRTAIRLVRGAPETAHVLYRRYGLGRSPAMRPSAIELQGYVEQPPRAESRVFLGDARDAFGLRRICVDWRLGELEHRTLRVMTEVVGREFARLGLGRVDPAAWLAPEATEWTRHLSDAYHHAGTTRMSADAATGVVDENLRVHGIANLFVCGSSVFPTSGYANPTLTIVALALRLGEHLATSATSRGARTAKVRALHVRRDSHAPPVAAEYG